MPKMIQQQGFTPISSEGQGWERDKVTPEEEVHGGQLWQRS